LPKTRIESTTAIATIPTLIKGSGAPPDSSRPTVMHEPATSTSVATCPARVSCEAQATASAGAARSASHGRAPRIAQPSASAQPGGTSRNAVQVRTSAVPGKAEIAAMTTTIDSGRINAHLLER
jgi:hypothetical protein